MNSLKSRLGVKIVAVILFVVSFILAAASGSGVLYMAYHNVYFDGGNATREEIINDYMETEMQNIAYAIEAEINSDIYEKYYGYDSNYHNYLKKDSNLSIKVSDKNGEVLYSSLSNSGNKYEKYTDNVIFKAEQIKRETLDFETYQERWNYIEECQNKYYNVEYDAYDMNTDEDEALECVLEISYLLGENIDVQIYGAMGDKLDVKDQFYFNLKWYDFIVSIRYVIIAVAVVSLVLCISMLIFLICGAGHRPDKDGIQLNWADKIPFDLYIVVILLTAVFILEAIVWFLNCIGTALLAIALMTMAAICFVLLLLAMILSFATRAKAGAWWKNTLIFRVIMLIYRGGRLIITSVPVMPKIFIMLAITCGILLFTACMYPENGSIVLWLMECVVLVLIVVKLVQQLKTLKNGIVKISEGDFNCHIDTGNLLPELKDCGEKINSIGSVLSKEVNERMKSERFKTELITNVSHDIKTPLTSIINYVDLIKKKDCKDEELNKYVDVLDRQSGRLKKLIEDLVECSKAQTGNISVNKAKLDLGVLLDQVVGEYQEKLEANNLSLVVSKPEYPVYISADGRLLWRAVENLLNNTCKYALPQTRVYLSLEVSNSAAVVALKNISKEALNVSGEELMERFVRGDSSRNTEGSGLGLSIAKSLIELQQAKMDLEIDGDLFKVVLRFSVMNQ